MEKKEKAELPKLPKTSLSVKSTHGAKILPESLQTTTSAAEADNKNTKAEQTTNVLNENEKCDVIAMDKVDRVLWISPDNVQPLARSEGINLLKAENIPETRTSSGTESKYETEPSEKSDENISDVSSRRQRTTEKRRKRKVSSTVPLVALHKNSQSDNSSIDSRGSRMLDDGDGFRERRSAGHETRRASETVGGKRPSVGHVRPHGGKKSSSAGGRLKSRASGGAMGMVAILSRDEPTMLLAPPGGGNRRAVCTKTLSTPVAAQCKCISCTILYICKV